MRLSISIDYEIEVEAGEDQAASEEIIGEVIEAKAADFASAIRNQLAMQGMTNIRMSVG